MRRFHLTYCQPGVRRSPWFTIETLSEPCNALLEATGCTRTSATAGSRQRRVSTSGSSVSGTPIFGSRGRHQPCVLHVGPVATERLQLGRWLPAPPDLGSPMAKHVQRTTPHASSLLFAALQLNHRGTSKDLRAACRCKPPSTWSSVVGVLLSAASRMRHALRLCA